MLPLPVVETLEQIDVIACRARAVIAILLLHYCTPLEVRHSELGDEQMVDVLELLEDTLDQIRDRAAIRERR